ncbi:hypothetical protein TCDM_13508 [Trypanosoma cruzi Dm28c]|uniref:Uncharacterized protein n=1 Tax=Trypanosoma cruzi Dm28c TaxID=1416333 RepID=V5ASK6_TRYCR|nr:hypothetical protein TCDM_13508 [Trypanosoma cruzi Dm28c]
MPCVPAQLLHSHTHRHAHDDGPVRLACCTHEEGPRRTARRGSRDVWACDEGLWGGAHISFLFCFLCGQGWQTPTAPHTQPHPAAVSLRFFFFFLFHALAVPSAFLSLLMIFFFAALTLPME